jgi:hypothetical protein
MQWDLKRTISIYNHLGVDRIRTLKNTSKMGISLNMPYSMYVRMIIYIYTHIRTVNTIEFKQHLEDHQERASELLRTTIVSHVCQDLLTRLTVMILPPTISIPEVSLVNYPGAWREWFGAIGVSIFPSPTKWGANWTYYECPNDMVLHPGSVL